MMILLMACSSGFTDEALPVSESGLPDLLFDLDDSGCEDLEGNSIAGAVAWYWGEYWYTDSGYEGEERLLYFANDAWATLDGGDCEVVWQTTAVVGHTGACGACNTGMSVTAVLDVGQTTCPDGLQGDKTWSEDYALSLREDESAEWFFASSGAAFAEGYHNDDALNYRSDKSCAWFGGG